VRKYFGTDGIRGVANTELTPELAFKVAKASAIVLGKNKKEALEILIGKDTRISGGLIESAMVTGFLSSGANVSLLSVIPTPGVAYLTKKNKADAGIVISASHNPYEFNGIKYFSNLGMKISDAIEEEIESVMESGEFNVVSHEKIGICKNMETEIQEYVQLFEDTFKNNLKVNDDFIVGIDASNGATSDVVEDIFKKLNIKYKIIYNTPNGVNINKDCGSTYLDKLKDFVINNNLSLGVAFDGDGDRCLAVDEKGNIVTGDEILAVISLYLKEKGKLKDNTLVATVMSNLGLSKFAVENGINLIQSKVGDRYVLEDMLKGGYTLGGEESGHVIELDYNPTGDGMFTALSIIQVMLEKNKTLSELTSVISIYPQVLINAKVENTKKNDYDKDEVITRAIKELEEEFSGNGRVLIRPSGTEPKVRVMIEGEDKDYITTKAKQIADLIEARLK